MALFGLFKKKKKEDKKAKAPAAVEKNADAKDENPIATENDTKKEEVKISSRAKTSPAAEAKSISKSEEKPAVKAAPKAVAKPAPKAAEKPAIKVEPKAESKPADKPKEKSATKPAPKTEIKSDVKAKEKPTAKAEEKTPTSVSDSNAVSAGNFTGTFEINKSKDGKKFFFNLYASNKVGIASSQMYSSSQSALNGVKSVIANAASSPIEDQSLKKYDAVPYPKWEIYIDNGGKYRFRLNASNGNCVCHSQGYTTKSACKNGIDSIIRSSKNAEIIKTYIEK